MDNRKTSAFFPLSFLSRFFALQMTAKIAGVLLFPRNQTTLCLSCISLSKILLTRRTKSKIWFIRRCGLSALDSLPTAYSCPEWWDIWAVSFCVSLVLSTGRPDIFYSRTPKFHLRGKCGCGLQPCSLQSSFAIALTNWRLRARISEKIRRKFFFFLVVFCFGE